MAIAYIVSCYPGLLHGDGWNIWMIAETDQGWSDWHPVSYIFLIRSLLKYGIIHLLWYAFKR